MKGFVFVLLLLSLMGCATTVAPSYVYLPEGVDGPEMILGARAEHGLYTDKIFITVDGKDLLQGEITTWKLEEKLSGTYRGKQIKAYCFAVNDELASLTRHYCTIYIEGRKIAQLPF